MAFEHSALESKGRVCTLGMFILDHFQVDKDGVPMDEPSIGGGGIFAMTAARLFLPPSHCGMIIDEGFDFPASFKTQLSAMGKDMTWFRKRDGKTTRALNLYSTNTTGEGHQTFKYVSPQLQLSLKDLILPPSPFATRRPEWVHVVVRIPRAREIAAEARRIQEGMHGIDWVPKMIWEPLGVNVEDCRAQLAAWLQLAPHFTAISPNLIELQTVLDHDLCKTTLAAEHAAATFCSMLPSDLVLVLRAGSLGSYTISPGWSGWTPAYWTSEEQNRVIDPTGGGNAFLGGLCAGLLLTDGDWRKANIHASAAASFAIQQRGLPRMTSEDRWNDDDPWVRLSTLHERIHGDTCHQRRGIAIKSESKSERNIST